MSIEVNDTVWYLDANGSRCQGIVSGWKNLAGDAAPLLGPRGEHQARSEPSSTREHKGMGLDCSGLHWPLSSVTRLHLSRPLKRA